MYYCAFSGHPECSLITCDTDGVLNSAILWSVHILNLPVDLSYMCYDSRFYLDAQRVICMRSSHYMDAIQYLLTTPRKNVCACVNLTCNSITNLMRSCSERFQILKMAVKRSDFIVRLYSQISSAKINMSF